MSHWTDPIHYDDEYPAGRPITLGRALLVYALSLTLLGLGVYLAWHQLVPVAVVAVLYLALGLLLNRLVLRRLVDWHPVYDTLGAVAGTKLRVRPLLAVALSAPVPAGGCGPAPVGRASLSRPARLRPPAGSLTAALVVQPGSHHPRAAVVQILFSPSPEEIRQAQANDEWWNPYTAELQMPYYIPSSRHPKTRRGLFATHLPACIRRPFDSGRSSP